ncbi:MAG: dipeptidase [Proteobacteria bacterium]|nr:dipeptidase [Pseudomonadota bacterium]
MSLTRREFASCLSLFAASCAMPRRPAVASPSTSYDRVIVIDGLGFPGGMKTDWHHPLTPAQVGHLRQSGLTCTHLTVGSVGTVPALRAFADIMRSIAFWESQIDAHPQALLPIRRAADINRAEKEARTGLVYGLQDGVSFETDLDRLPVMHQFGIRVIQPTYNRRNLLGDGCMEPSDAGLSRTGHQAIEVMNELGILVDLSHCGRRTAADAIAISTKPIAFTHTGCAAVIEHPRHRSDQELRAVADKGGVVGIYVMPYLAGGRQPEAADVIRHLEHAIDVAGEDHVSIGTDGTISPTELTDEYRKKFADNIRERRESGIAAPGETETGYLFAADLNTPRRLETLATMLLARGHSQGRVDKILGRNLLRVFAATWR